MRLQLPPVVQRGLVWAALWIGMLTCWMYWAYQQQWKIDIFATALTPDAGWHAVPREVRLMKILIQRHQATHYRLGGTYAHPGVYRLDRIYADQSLIHQRAIEFLYPVRFDDQAPLVLIPTSQELPDCQLIDHQQTVALYDCQR